VVVLAAPSVSDEAIGRVYVSQPSGLRNDPERRTRVLAGGRGCGVLRGRRGLRGRRRGQREQTRSNERSANRTP
jgi:hypothetical protein